LIRCEDLKQEREAEVDCMMEFESEFPTATNEKKVVMILDQACRNVNARAAYDHAIITQMCVCQELLTCITYYQVVFSNEGQKTICLK